MFWNKTSEIQTAPDLVFENAGRAKSTLKRKKISLEGIKQQEKPAEGLLVLFGKTYECGLCILVLISAEFIYPHFSRWQSLRKLS